MSVRRSNAPTSVSRRDLLRTGFYGLGVSAALPVVLRNTSDALAAHALAGDAHAHPERILVVAELSGGNDGLNTVVPYADDAYYRLRPTIGIPEAQLLKLEDGYGFHPSLVGFQQLYDDGRMAVVHGCGYDNPSLSHFTSMGYWHTAAPNSGEKLGWLGRFADARSPKPQENLIVNIGNAQSLAVRSAGHTPLVFNDPGRFRRDGADDQRAAFEQMSRPADSGNDTLRFLKKVAHNAVRSSAFVRQAFASYRTPIDYGAGAGIGNDLRKVAALIDSGMPTRVYYVSFGGNAFDTHVHQPGLHARLLMYTADAIRGFFEDLERIGRANDVAVMMFTEFGRRAEENASLGTDHGTATPLFVFGNRLKGGLHGEHPSLTELDDGNLVKTTDFRRVYATMIEEWMGFEDAGALLGGEFEPLGMFA